MFDTNWDLIQGEAAHEIEVLNQANQANVIEAVVRFLLHHHGTGEDGCPQSPPQNILRELHRTGTLLLLEKAGQYREEPVYVIRSDGSRYDPPPHEEVRRHLDQFFSDVPERWPKSTAVEMGSYFLWMVNWVHPFKNGNGRSARAFCYMCISLKMGFVLPGAPTVLQLIKENNDEYHNALVVADTGYAEKGEPDLSVMNNMLQRLLEQQFDSIPAE